MASARATRYGSPALRAASAWRDWEVVGADGVEQRETLRRRPAHVDAREGRRGDLRRIPLAEARPANPQERSPEQRREKRGARRCCHAKADREEHGAKRRQPLLDVPADQVLLGGAAPQLERVGGVSAFHGVEVRLRRLGSPTRVDQGVAEPDAEKPARSDVGRGTELAGEAIELGGAVERQGLRGAVGGGRGIFGRAFALARLLKMQGQGLGIGRARSFERGREASMVSRSSSADRRATTASRMRSWYGSISSRSRHWRTRM